MGTSFAELERAGAQATPVGLRLGRHAVGITAAALLNPFIYYVNDRALTWAVTWIGAVGLAGVLFGLYALFFTRRAKAAWPRSFILLAWVLLGLVLAGNWVTYSDSRTGAAASVSPAPAGQTEWERGVLTAPAPR